MANRVQDAIEELRPNPLLANVPEGVITIDFKEHAAYQDCQAVAFASQVLTMDEASVIYNALGEVYSEANTGWSEGVDKATKVTVIRLVGELIERRLFSKARRV